jgi:hypothetical protein
MKGSVLLSLHVFPLSHPEGSLVAETESSTALTPKPATGPAE